MTMNNRILSPVRLEEIIPPSFICEMIQPFVMRAMVDPATQSPNFCVKGSLISFILNKIELHLGPIHASVQVHNHGFCPATVQNTDDMQDANGFRAHYEYS